MATACPKNTVQQLLPQHACIPVNLATFNCLVAHGAIGVIGRCDDFNHRVSSCGHRCSASCPLKQASVIVACWPLIPIVVWDGRIHLSCWYCKDTGQQSCNGMNSGDIKLEDALESAGAAAGCYDHTGCCQVYQNASELLVLHSNTMHSV